MAKFGTISRPLAKITMSFSLAMRGARSAPLVAKQPLMVFFARGREIVPIFAMSDAWLASKNMEHPPRAIRKPISWPFRGLGTTPENPNHPT